MGLKRKKRKMAACRGVGMQARKKSEEKKMKAVLEKQHSNMETL